MFQEHQEAEVATFLFFFHFFYNGGGTACANHACVYTGGNMSPVTSAHDAHAVPKTKDGKCPILPLNDFVCAEAAGMKYW